MDGAALTKKIFQTDLEAKVNMTELWKDGRKPPVPLSNEQLVVDENLDRSKLDEHAVWSLEVSP
jgi:hypothetical protein